MAHQLFRFATLSLIAATCPLTTMAQERYPVLEEIIVTAQKRSQSLQDVPIAITAISQEMLENQNIYDVLDLQKAVPSLTIVQGYNRANGVPMIIRGMGTLGAQPAFEGSVGTYVDGVYRSRPGMVLSSMLDIGRVEVLRGPQGTLFGKNTTAGAITMASNQPAPEFGYGGEVTLGDYDRQRFTGHVTGPISDALLARLAVLSDQRNGFTDAVYQHDDYGDLDTQAIKGSLLWKANDDVDIKLIADYSDSNEVCCFGNPVPFNRAMSLTGGPFNDYYREAAQANFDTTKDLLALDPDDRENRPDCEADREGKSTQAQCSVLLTARRDFLTLHGSIPVLAFRTEPQLLEVGRGSLTKIKLAGAGWRISSQHDEAQWCRRNRSCALLIMIK